MRILEGGSKEDRSKARHLKQVFAIDQLPPEDNCVVYVMKSNGKLLKLPVWTARRTPCHITRTRSIVAGRWYWIESQSESTACGVAYIVGIIPPKHDIEDDPLDAEAACDTQVVLLWAMPDGRSSKTRHYYCSELVEVVASEQVQGGVEGDTFDDDEILVPDLGFLHTRTMRTYHGTPEVSVAHVPHESR